jgi:RES domain-containing protein
VGGSLKLKDSRVIYFAGVCSVYFKRRNQGFMPRDHLLLDSDEELNQSAQVNHLTSVSGHLVSISLYWDLQAPKSLQCSVDLSHVIAKRNVGRCTGIGREGDIVLGLLRLPDR